MKNITFELLEELSKLKGVRYSICLYSDKAGYILGANLKPVCMFLNVRQANKKLRQLICHVQKQKLDNILCQTKNTLKR